MSETLHPNKETYSSWRAPENGTRLYPERPSGDSSLTAKAEYLQKFFEGNIQGPELSETERAELLDHENNLGIELERINEMDAKFFDFYPDYFLSDKGAFTFRNLFGKEPETRTNVVATFLSHPEIVHALKTEQRDELSGSSRIFAREQFLTEYEKANGDIRKVDDPERAALIPDPDTLLTKVHQLAEFRARLQNEKQALQEKKKKGELTQGEIAQDAILTLYSRRSHELMRDAFEAASTIVHKAGVLGADRLTHPEEAVLTYFAGTRNWKKRAPKIARHLAQFDKFIFGASDSFTEYEEDGEVFRDRTQIPPELLAAAEESVDFYTDEYITALQSRPLEARDIDSELVKIKHIDAATFESWVHELYREYGIESAYQGAEGDPTLMAPDRKWRTFVTKGVANIRVEANRVMLIPAEKPRDVTAAIPTLAHEITHVFQAENRAAAPLRLFKKLNPDRRSIASEAAAMSMESRMSRQLFGIPKTPVPYHVRGIARKLSGGSFKDVFKQMDTDTQFILRAQVEGGIVPESQFTSELKKQRKTRFDSALRLFGGPVPLSENNRYVTSTRTTVYLEQEVFMRTLEKTNTAWLTDFGVHPDTMILLSQTGLLQPQKLQHLNPESIQIIWQRIAHEYKK